LDRERVKDSLLIRVTLVICQVEAEYLTSRFGLSVPGVLRRLKKKCFQPPDGE